MFFRQGDYRTYVSLMREWCARCGLRVWAYCLMPNHVHLIVVPPSEEALCRAIGEAHRRYTREINFRKKWRGHLWQGRFASYVMDEPYLIAAARYVERNPVRAGLVRRAEEWEYSSAAAHAELGGPAGRAAVGRSRGAQRGEPTGLAEAGPWAEGDWLRERLAGWVCTWGEHLRQDDEAGVGEQLRRHESTGRPLGPERFLERLGQRLGRNLLPGKPGRPHKGNKQYGVP